MDDMNWFTSVGLAALGLINVLVGVILKVIWDSISDLKRTDSELAEKVSSIEILVAGNYITRAEFVDTLKSIHSKLDRIDDKLSAK